MKRISASFISLVLFLMVTPSEGQDTIDIPLRAGAGISLRGPAMMAAGEYPMGFELNLSYDRDERITYLADIGYSRFINERYNYHYRNSGIYIKAGADYNLLNPLQSQGRYYAGIGGRYGLALFRDEAPFIRYDNYWGSHTSVAGESYRSGHFIEITPGIRAALTDNLFIGWNVNLSLLLYTSGRRDLRPVDIPGFGNGSGAVVTGINYFISIRIPYRTETVIYKRRVREIVDEDDTGTPVQRF